MTNQEYEDLKLHIDHRRVLEIKRLNEKYAFENKLYKEGDVLSDHKSTILVDEIKYAYRSSFGEYPECVYWGYMLRKDGTPRKDKARDSIYQSNIQNNGKVS